MAKLGEVCIQITDGSHNPPSGVEQSEYLMLSSKNIDDDFITLDSPRFLSHSDYIAENKRTTVSEGDLLMTIVGTIGRVAIVPEELKGICLQRSVAVIKPEREVVNNRYLMYQLQNMRPFLEKEARGVAQKGIYLKQVSQLDIKLPELEHQMQIVKVLDKASKLIFLRRQQLAKLDELVKAKFVEMFENSSWPNTSLNDICSEIVDCPHSTPKYEGNLEHPAIRTTEIKKGYIDWDSMKYVSEEEYQKRIKSLKPVPGDIVYGREGTYGNAAIIPDGYEFCLGQRVMLFRPNKTKCISAYVLYAILSDHVKRQADEKNVGATVPHVNVADAKQFDVVLPPLSIQNQFAAFVERVDQQKQTVQESLEKLELMKKALMQEYFG